MHKASNRIERSFVGAYITNGKLFSINKLIWVKIELNFHSNESIFPFTNELYQRYHPNNEQLCELARSARLKNLETKVSVLSFCELCAIINCECLPKQLVLFSVEDAEEENQLSRKLPRYHRLQTIGNQTKRQTRTS